jgi:orotidine-5'-phosphate decarboxylase
MIDRLIDRIIELKNPVCVGLDTKFDYLPEQCVARTADPLETAARSIYGYNRALIDAVCDIVPSVKVQSAYYEMYGWQGVKCFYDTVRYAKGKGLIVIADVKRNDIGATASAYAAAYLGKTDVRGETAAAFDADFATVNGYLGTDGVKPFADACASGDKGIFVLVKTSNASSGELQDLDCGGAAVYERMADMVAEWGAGLIGRHGYSDVGAVIGATYPAQAERIRGKHPGIFVLIPGYGAQGGGTEGILPNFDSRGRGGIVNNSRAILTAYRSGRYAGKDFADAARAAALDMQCDILDTFAAKGISY